MLFGPMVLSYAALVKAVNYYRLDIIQITYQKKEQHVSNPLYNLSLHCLFHVIEGNKTFVIVLVCSNI